jgi:argininosuccinate synthase
LALKYAEMVYYGQWFTALREALDAFFDRATRFMTGSVRVKLLKGTAETVGASSRYSLYSEKLASFTMGTEYDPTDAVGFIKLFGLPMQVQAAIQKTK